MDEEEKKEIKEELIVVAKTEINNVTKDEFIFLLKKIICEYWQNRDFKKKHIKIKYIGEIKIKSHSISIRYYEKFKGGIGYEYKTKVI